MAQFALYLYVINACLLSMLMPEVLSSDILDLEAKIKVNLAAQLGQKGLFLGDACLFQTKSFPYIGEDQYFTVPNRVDTVQVLE